MELGGSEHRGGGLGGWIGLLFAAISAVVAYTEYRSNQRQNKIERTLNYYNYFTDINAHQVSFELMQVWDSEASKLDAALGANPSRADDKKVYDAFVIDLVQRNNIRSKVLLMIDFYNSLSTCVSARLCDKDTALRFYGPEARSFRNNFFTYVEAYKKQNHEVDLTRPLERFVDDYKALRPAPAGVQAVDDAGCHYLPDALATLAQDLGIGC